MAGRYKAYPEYKDSGVAWLGEVPVGWDRVPLKYMALGKHSLFLDGDWIESKDLSDGGIRYITTGSVGVGEFKEQGAGFISEDKFMQLGCTEVFEGDVLISRLNAPIGRSCVVPFHNNRIVTSVDNVIFRPDKEFVKEFLVYLFSSAEYFVHTGNLARGATMQRISRGLLGNVRAVIPSLPEQKQIARFLDHETGKIDRLIAKQQALIALLKEKRQAVISHAVTKGLNPHATMKDSGVEWLGDVPEHWEVKPLKYFADSVNTGGTPKEESSFSDEGEVEWFTPGDFADDLEIPRAKKHVTRVACYKGDAKVYRKGSILVIGIGATLGRVSWCDRECSCNQQINVIEVSPTSDGKFLAFSLSAQEDQMKNMASAATLAIMNQEKTKALWLSGPDIVEQREIVAFLEVRETNFKALLEIAETQINLLQERRTALISAAVTGKIDVRDWEPACAGGTEE